MMTRTDAPRRGYTLMEVLISLGIFAIGFVAVAAMFPAATHLQRETIQDVTSLQFARTVEAQLKARPFPLTSMPASPSGNVQVISGSLDTPANGADDWTLYDRSHPSYGALTDRAYAWVPVVRCTNVASPANADNWQVFVFVLKCNTSTVYTVTGTAADDANPNDVPNFPGVCRLTVVADTTDPNDHKFTLGAFNNDPDSDGIGDYIAAGDQILDQNGTIYTVKSADGGEVHIDGPILEVPLSPTSIWYGRAGSSSVGLGNPPTRRILLITGAVK